MHSCSKVGPNNVSNKWADDENLDYVDDDFVPATLVHQTGDPNFHNLIQILRES